MSVNGVRVWDASTGHPVTPILSLPNGDHASINRDSRYLLTTGRKAAQLWSLVPDPRSIEDLQLLARLISGHQIDETAALVPSTPEAICDAWNVIQPKYAKDATPPARAAVRWHQYAFPLAYENRDWTAAAWHLKRLFTLQPAGWRLHAKCGFAFGNLGLWKDAAEEYSQATALGSDDVTDWSQVAMTRLKCGDVAEYRIVCAEMLRRFGESEDPEILADAIRAGVLASDAATGLEPLVNRLDHLPDDDKRRDATLVGAVLYRVGKFDQAVTRLTAAIPSDVAETAVMGWIFLAMSHHRNGQNDEAKLWLAKANEWLGHHQQAHDSQVWYESLPLELLLDEAMTLVAP